MSIGMGNSSGEFTALHFTADRVPVAKTTIHQGEEASEEELTALAFEKHPSSLRISTRCFPGKNDGLLETCFGPHEHLKGSPSLNLHEDEGWFGGTLAEHQECSEANVPTTL